MSYYNGTAYTFTWEGRRLVGAVKGSNTMSFEYNDEGIRTSKNVNGIETVYYVNGGQIVAEKTGTRTIVYIYDASGAPIGMMYRTTSYAENVWDVFWYEKNLQGDIVAVYNSSGTKLVTYDYYDAWGNFTVSYSNNGATTGAQYNPFRYRGYYYDTDLGMYYLQSRYYDARICRFINADVYVSTSQGILGNNMFAYCNNNPTIYFDPSGEFALLTFLGVVAITALAGAIDGGITAAMSEQDFWKGFAAGAIGGAVGGVINYFLPGVGNLLGRAASTMIYDVTNEIFQTGSFDSNNLGVYVADTFMDVAYSMIYLDKVGHIANPLIGAAVAGLIDAGVDIVETELLLSPRAQQRIRDTSNRAKINNTNYLDKIMYA